MANPHIIMLYNDDCFNILPSIEDKSVDMILCDPPYEVTSCEWDSILPLDRLWEQYRRIIKDDGCIVMFATQPFTTRLIASNYDMYRYNWIWNKTHASNFQLAKLQPMRVTEDICVFSKGKSANGATVKARYNPQKEMRDRPVKNGGGLNTSTLLNRNTMKKQYNTYYDRYPTNILTFARESHKLHPTQKPIPLLEYLIRTYTDEGDTVLDNCMGSGSTGVAAINTNRQFIGIEKDIEYYKIAKERIQKVQSVRRIDDYGTQTS